VRILRRTDERGYTLVEFAIVMSILAIFMSIATPLLFSQIRSGLDTEQRIDLQQGARAALRTMVRELRQASALYASVDNPTASDRLSFGVDYDGDGTIGTGAPWERITYYRKSSDGALYRGPKLNQGQVLAENVDEVTFEMFGSNLALDTDNNGVVEQSELNPFDGTGPWTTSELANVTRVVITLTVAENGTSQTYDAQALLRNRVAG
jgi:prepilin-type N-terminal cleavage/methylation domain-containing protein